VCCYCSVSLLLGLLGLVQDLIGWFLVLAKPKCDVTKNGLQLNKTTYSPIIAEHSSPIRDEVKNADAGTSKKSVINSEG
jgi:hypothetical protein